MKTLTTLALVGVLAASTAGCMSQRSAPAVDSGRPAAAAGTAAAAGGFVSTGTSFTCTAGPRMVSGIGSAITIDGGGDALVAQGGPLVYRATGTVVVFDNASYERFRVLNGATLVNTCTR